MPARATAKNEQFNPEEYYGGEKNREEEKNAVKLQQARAAEAVKKQTMEQGPEGDLTQIPKLLEESEQARQIETLVEQGEYGGLAMEKPEGEEEEEEPEEGEEMPEEGEGGEGAEEERQTMEEEQLRDIAAAAESAKTAEDLQFYDLLQSQILLQRQIRFADSEMMQRLRPVEKEYNESRRRDVGRNFIKRVRNLAYAGFSPPLVFTIIVPLLMIMLIIAAFILFLCGINLGRPSLKTIQLRSRLESRRQEMKKVRDTRVKALTLQLQQTNAQLSKLA